MSSITSGISKFLVCLTGLGVFLWLAGCQDSQNQSGGGSPASAPANGSGAKEKNMQRNGIGTLDVEDGIELGEEGVVRDDKQFTELAALDIGIGNGSLTVERGELESGEVQLRWVIKPNNGLGFKADPQDLEIVIKEDNGLLAVTDEYHGPKLGNNLTVDMVATIADDIEVVASIGNGDLKVDALRLKEADCGNGNVNLTGELVGDADISVGNGKLVAMLLIRSGNHGLSVGNGSIKLTAEQGSSFDFEASTGVGSVKVTGSNAQETSREWGFVGGEVQGKVGNGGGADVEMSVGNGSVKLNAE